MKRKWEREEEEGPEERRNTARGLPEIIPEDQRGAVRSNSKEWQYVVVVGVVGVVKN